MIYSLHGKLTVKEMGFVVVECAGVGYGCRTSYNTVAALGNVGSEVTLYTHLAVREDAVELFGFATSQELSCFRLIISVSGIGPKAATSILSDMTPEKFAYLVVSGDSKAFTKTKGIGAKTAQRLVLELKDKISSEAAGAGAGSAIDDIPIPGETSNAADALAALMALGYSQTEAAPYIRKQDQSLSTQELITGALRLMNSGK